MNDFIFYKKIVARNFENFEKKSQNFGNFWNFFFPKTHILIEMTTSTTKKSNLLRISHT